MPFAATWMMDEPKDYHAKSSKSDRGRQMSYDIHMQNLKTDTNESVCETEAESRTQRIDWWFPRRKWAGEGKSRSLGLEDENW